MPSIACVLRRARVPLLASLLLLLPGCIGEKQEQELGDEMAANVNAQVALVRNPLLNAYVSSLGRALAAVSDRPNLRYHFYIINSAVVNAFALPGGYIYVTRGLIERTTSGAELAGVLAHEIGHVVRRHGVEQLQRQLRTGSVVNVLYGLIFGGEPGLLRENALSISGSLWTASHSRKDEEEADRLAVVYLLRAGIDPEAMVTLLQTLLAEEESSPTPASRTAGWFSSHPLTADRIAKTRAEIQSAVKTQSTPVSQLRFSSYPAFLNLVSTLPPPPDGRD